MSHDPNLNEPELPEPAEPEAPPEAEPEHHSLGEEIRHEIEAVGEEIRHDIEVVVEHVPAPVRWTIRRLFTVIALSLLGLLVVVVLSAVLWVMNRTEWVAQELTLVVNQTLAQRSDVTLEMRDIRGNPFVGVKVVGPRLRFRNGPVLMEAKSLNLRYAFWGLATGGKGPIEIELDQPVVKLERGKDGKLRLPIWRSAPSRPGSSRGIEAIIAIHDGRLEAPAPYGPIEGLELAASASTGEPTRVQVQRLTWKIGPYHSRLDGLVGELEAGKRVSVRIRRLDSPDLALTGNGSWPADKPQEFTAHVDVARARWRWLALLFDNDAFDEDGECAVSADLEGSPSVHGSFQSTLTWAGLPAEGHGSFRYEHGRWIVEPLIAHSRAGDLTGHFEYDRRGWTVGGDVVHGDPEQWDAIHITGWPTGDVQGRFRYVVDTERRNGELQALLGPSLLAGWRTDSAAVHVALPGRGEATFTVDTQRRGGGLHLDGASTPDGWRGTYVVRDLPLEEWPDGRASGIRGIMNDGRGTVEGRRDGLFVTGDLKGRETDWLGAHLHEWTVHDLAGRLLPQPDLDARTRLSNLMYLGLHFDSAAAAVHLGDAVVRLDSVGAFAADTVVSLAGESRWNPKGWTVRFDRATLRSHQFEWHAEPPVLLAGDPTGVTFEQLQAHDGDAHVTMSGRWAGPGGYYDWTATGQDLHLDRLGMPDALRLDGRANATLRVTGVSGDPRWTFDGTARRPGYSGHHGDSLAIRLEGSPGRLDVTRLVFGVDGGSIMASGRAEAMAAWPDSLTPLGILHWVDGAQRWQAEAHAREVPLDDLHEMVPAAKGWGGRVAADLTVRGRPQRPELELNVRARPLSWNSQRLDEASLHATYRDERLVVTDGRMTRDQVVSTASGSMPLILTLARPPQVPDRPMQWTIQVPKGDLAVMPAFVPQIGAAAGRFDLDAEVAGTPRTPRLTGSLKVRDGAVRPAAREEILDHVYADFTLSESQVRLDTLSARQGQHGRVNGHGVVDIGHSGLKGYGFDFDLRQFTASDPAFYVAEFDGRFHVADGPRLNGQVLPQVTGTANVRRAAILFDFTSQSEAQVLAASAQPLFWTYRVDVQAKDKLKWTPREADIEFNADLTVEQTTDSLIIFGEMHALRGTYFFLSNRFNVANADLVFDNAKDGINPTLDASATTRIAAPATTDVTAGSGVEVPHDVTVTISGRAKEPKVTFESSPPDWDQSRVLRELTLGSFVSGPNGQVDFSQPVDTYLTQAINRQLSAELSRTFKGYLNDWELQRESGGLISGNGAVIMSVSSQPVRNVNLRYRQRLPGSKDYVPSSTVEDPFESSIEAEYRLSRFIYFSTELTKRLQSIGTTSTNNGAQDFKVNLKARWEY